MHSRTLLATSPLLLLLSAAASAQSATVSEYRDWYWDLSLGLVTTESSSGPDEEIDFDEGYGISLGVGKRFGVEAGSAVSYTAGVEVVWTDQDADDDFLDKAVRDVTIGAVFLNGTVEYAMSPSVGLYGGLGVGPAWLNVGNSGDELNEFDDEDGPFLAWEAKAGLRFRANESTSWNLGYRFLNVDDVELDDDIGDGDFDLETQQHILAVGVRWAF